MAVPVASTNPLLRQPEQPTKALPLPLIKGARDAQHVAFDYNKHINFEFPKNIYTMKELGKEGDGISDTAISETFPLFNEEAVKQMRADIFSDRVLEKYQCSSKLASIMIRNYCPENAPFIYEAWNHPKVLEALSRVAGIELVPAMDCDVGHANISVGSGEVIAPPLGVKSEESVVGWHFDSYAFVLCHHAFRLYGNVRGRDYDTNRQRRADESSWAYHDKLGTAVIMQSRYYIKHQALKAFGGRERINVVTSFRPKSPFIIDETVIRPLFDFTPISTLYR